MQIATSLYSLHKEVQTVIRSGSSIVPTAPSAHEVGEMHGKHEITPSPCKSKSSYEESRAVDNGKADLTTVDVDNKKL